MNVEDTECTKNEADRFINKSMVSVLPVFAFCPPNTLSLFLFFVFFLIIQMATYHRPSLNLQKAE